MATSMRAVQGILTIVLLQFLVTDGQVIQSATLTVPSTSKVDTYFDIELTFTIAQSAIGVGDQGDFYITYATITLPGVEYEAETDCRLLVDGTSDCTTNTAYDLNVDAYVNTVSITGSGVTDYDVIEEGLNFILIINSTGSSDFDVVFPLGAEIPVDFSDTDFSLSFTSEIEIFNDTDGIISTDTSASATLNVIGAFLDFTSTGTSTGGDSTVPEVDDTDVTQTFIIARDSRSNQDPAAIMINLEIYDTDASAVTSISINIDGNPSDITNADLTAIDVDSLSGGAYTLVNGDDITITVVRGTVGEDLKPGVGLSMYVRVDYEDDDGDSMYDVSLATFDADDVDFTDVGAVDMPSTISAGDTFTVSRTFTVPKGTLEDAYFFTEFDLELPMDSYPISQTSHSLTDDDNVLSIEFPSGVVEENSSRRRKRSIVNVDTPHLMRHRRNVNSYYLEISYGSIVNPSGSSADPADVSISVSFAVDSIVVGGGDLDARVGFCYNSICVHFTSGGVSLVAPSLSVTYTVEIEDDDKVPNIVKFTVFVEHSSYSNDHAPSVEVQAGKSNWEVFIYGDQWSGPDRDDVMFGDNSEEMTWNAGQLNMSDTLTWVWTSRPAKDGKKMDEGETTFTAIASWDNERASASDDTCVERDDIEITNVVTQHGLTALGFFVGIIVGALIALLVVFILYMLRRQGKCGGRPGNGVHDSYSKGRNYNSNQKVGLIVNANQSRGFNSKNSGSSNQSIVQTLTFKDRSKQTREIDNQDIQATMEADMDIEQERNRAMQNTTTALVHSLTTNGDISKGTEEKCRAKFQKRLSDLEKETGNSYDKEAAEIYKRLSAKNKHKLGELLERHAEERQLTEEDTEDLHPDERKQVKDLQKQEQEVELEELEHLLMLEQDEEIEKLRKEFAVRKRMGIKQAQQEYLDDIIKEAKLPPGEQVDWLMKEHFKSQAAVEKTYDDEISRQRMVLEEKLARRKALAAMSEAQDDRENEQLNTVAGQNIDLIKKAKKEGVLSASEAKQMIADANKEMMDNKERMDKDREQQEKALHAKLSALKQKKMADLKKRQDSELAAVDKSLNAGHPDPVDAMAERQRVISEQRAERAEVENEIDKEHAQELADLRHENAEKMLNELEEAKRKTTERLHQEGMSENDIKKLLNKHEKELNSLHAAHADQQQQQNANFEKRLAKQRAEWKARKEQEATEQETLREHEEKVVQNLVDNQVAMSEEDRLKVMQEHEKQMVKLENSLTLNKLSQKRMLEERLSRKRKAQMKKLESKQKKELKKSHGGDSDDEDSGDLRIKHAEQRLAVLQGEKMNVDDEVEDIKEELTKERANALKEQEVKLASMLAELQMAKAKEMARIEEQQKAIFNLKSNLMDDLNDKGVLSDPECQKVIEIHQKEQKKLDKKLESQRSKQEAALRKRLQERLAAKEEQMSNMQQSELRDLGGGLAAKMKRAALMEKHKLEIEKFRNRMEKEINQTMEELHRQNEVRRIQSLQEQELQFINGMVRLGKFEQEELENVVVMLFPAKTAEERKDILDRMCEGYKAPTPQPQRPGMQRRMTSLEQRALTTSLSKVGMLPIVERGRQTQVIDINGGRRASNLGTIMSDPDDPDNIPPVIDRSFTGSMASNSSKKKGKKSRLGPISGDYDPDFDSRSYGSSNLPFSDYNNQSRGSYDTGNYGNGYGYEDPSGYGRMPATRLPPLQASEGGKKKKKKKKQVAASDEDAFYTDGF